MPDSTNPQLKSAFVCDCSPSARPACEGEGFYETHQDEETHENKQYCVLHFPGNNKSAKFNEVLRRKLEAKDFNFYGVWFPEGIEPKFSEFNFSVSACFIYATFSEQANFDRATFSGLAQFQGAVFMESASFSNTTFNEETYFQDAVFKRTAYFNSATFTKKVSFSAATFRDAAFRFARFDGWAFFSNVTFGSQVDFDSARFGASASFKSATFAGLASFADVRLVDGLSFEGPETFSPASSSLNFRGAKIETPDHVSFDTLTLRPHWFVNVDARSFNFINVDWDWLNPAEAIASLESREVSSAYRKLSIACQRLATNAEDNNRYEDASKFRYMAMDVRRRERWRGFAFWKLSWWYWLASGYGERALQALVVLISILIIFAAIYTRVGFARWEPRLASEADVVTAKRDEIGSPLEFGRAMAYSAGVMTLQKPEPRPATRTAQLFVLLETILGPVQAALLALAIRRKFMR